MEILQTPRLRLRELRETDADALHQVLGDPVAMSAYEHGFDRDETQEWIARQRQRYAADGFGLWAMELRTTGEVIGDCGITRQSNGDREVLEVGYHLVRREWGRGLATEAARGCVSWAFDHTGTDDVYAIVRDTNLASMNVAIRLGMTVRTREVRHYRGVEMPHLAFAITRRDWDTGTVPPSQTPG